jgi:chromosome segregation ATPase
MAAIDEIHHLGHQLNDALKRRQELEGKRGKAADDAKKLREAIEVAQKKAKHHRNNRRHIKNSAATTDWVNFKEFSITIKSLESAEITVDESQRLLAMADSTVAGYDRETSALEANITRLRARLAKYGQIIPFRHQRKS